MVISVVFAILDQYQAMVVNRGLMVGVAEILDLNQLMRHVKVAEDLQAMHNPQDGTARWGNRRWAVQVIDARGGTPRANQCAPRSIRCSLYF